MKVKDITSTIDVAIQTIARLSYNGGYEKNVATISSIQDLIEIINEADIAICYGDNKRE